MPLRYLLDENLRGSLWRAVRRHNLTSDLPIDVLRIGDVTDLPLGADDPTALIWIERENRILVTKDKNSMAVHLADHLMHGRHCPGIFMVLPRTSLRDVLAHLILAAYASEPHEWVDRI